MSLDGYSREDAFVASIKRMRLGKSWTQARLAREMKDRGFGFHQPTIQRIEDGDRPVRLDEAYALADVLGSTVEVMSMDRRMLRSVAALQAVSAGLADSDALNRIATEWGRQADLLVGIVSAGLSVGPSNAEPWVWAGLEILRRGVERNIAIRSSHLEHSRPFKEALVDMGQIEEELPTRFELPERLEDDDSAPDDERHVRGLLRAVGDRIPDSIQSRSLPDLVAIASGDLEA